MNQPCLILFARPPKAGLVKTRLIPAIGADAAAEVYRRLLEHALDAASRLKEVRSELWCAGRDDGSCAAFADRFGMTLHRQEGGDLGERMYHALETALQTADKAVLIGSDSLDYDPGYLTQAFSSLEEHDAVLGPAADGGYLLIGLRRSERSLFDNMSWSNDGVLDETRRRLSALGWGWRELPTLRDVDLPEDLAQFPELIPK